MDTPQPVDNLVPDPDDSGFVYDELALLGDNCAEYLLSWDGNCDVQRIEVDLGGDVLVSGLRWGTSEPEMVFLHGSAQNAHTWDTVCLALRPASAVAFDLPGHGRSSWRPDGRYDPRTIAESIVQAIDAVISEPVLLVGMSLGGLTANRVAALRPDLVRALVVVDITPGVTRDKAREIHEFIAGPQSFGSFTEILERTVEFNPTRSAASLRRGILHNAHRQPDGSWEWNYHRSPADAGEFPDREELWSDVADCDMAYTLVRGADSPVVDAEDVAELRRRRPESEVIVVEGAGHSVQGDRPVELARILQAR